jgi:hypothetical protein
MVLTFLFRLIFLVAGFISCAWRWGDWKRWEKYYSTILFVIVVNLAASFLTYHHALWNYSPDAFIKTQTILEYINCFIILPSAMFLYLSRFPEGNAVCKIRYITLWVFIFGSLEYIDNNLAGGIYYTNGWSWPQSVLFDAAMFLIVRLHYAKPFWAWIVTLLLAILILVMFNFGAAEMK